jgi:hypothetical protein
MPRTWTSDTFPRFEEQIRNLTRQHQDLEDEPLHLAICYASGRGPQDIFLFEVIGGNGSDSVNSSREFFETTFTSTPSFPMAVDEQLHLILTNQRELEIAFLEGWPSLREVIEAIRCNEYRSLVCDEVGDAIMGRLLEAGRMEGAARG